MKTMMKRITTVALIGAALLTAGCTQQQKERIKDEIREEVADARKEVNKTKQDLGLATKSADKKNFDFKDHGGEPFVVDIEDYTKENTNFRTTVWTGSSLQMTLMSIPVGGDIGAEIHDDIEQFVRIESGKGEVYIGDTEETMQLYAVVGDDDIIMIPRGKWHNIKNTGDKPMKLYSLYSPAEHAKGAIHVTMEEGQATDH